MRYDFIVSAFIHGPETPASLGRDYISFYLEAYLKKKKKNKNSRPGPCYLRNVVDNLANDVK